MWGAAPQRGAAHTRVRAALVICDAETAIETIGIYGAHKLPMGCIQRTTWYTQMMCTSQQATPPVDCLLAL